MISILLFLSFVAEFDDDSSDSSDMSGYSSDEDIGMKPQKKSMMTTQARNNYQAQKPSAATNGVHRPAQQQRGDIGGYLGMDDYMKHMDKELSTTEMGKSFVKQEQSVSISFLFFEFFSVIQGFIFSMGF